MFFGPFWGFFIQVCTRESCFANPFFDKSFQYSRLLLRNFWLLISQLRDGASFRKIANFVGAQAWMKFKTRLASVVITNLVCLFRIRNAFSFIRHASPKANHIPSQICIQIRTFVVAEDANSTLIMECFHRPKMCWSKRKHKTMRRQRWRVLSCFSHQPPPVFCSIVGLGSARLHLFGQSIQI